MSEGNPKLQLVLLGDFRVTIHDVDVTPARTSALCIVLLLALGDSERESRARIRALLWPDADPKRAGENLRQSLYYLRRHWEASGFDGLTVTRTHVSLDRQKLSSDADQLLAEIVEQDQLPQRILDTPDLADSYVNMVVEQSDTFNHWIVERRLAYRSKLQKALQQLLARPGLADEKRRQCATLLLTQDPGDEEACRALMRLSVAHGETAEALRSYNALWTYLEEELDVEPSEQTQSLAVAIKLGETTEDSGSGAPRVATRAEESADNADAVANYSVSPRQFSLLVERDTSSSRFSVACSGDKFWSEIGSHIAAALVPAHHGRLVSSGDERIVLAFDRTRTAVEAALAIQDFASARFKACGDRAGPPLRIAIDAKGEVVDKDQISEPEVSGLIELAAPGEVVASVEVKDQITHTLDANVEDLGDHGLASNEDPVRAYRIHAPQPEMPVPYVPALQQKSRSLLPTIAVIPPTTFASGDGIIGEILADEIISVLSVTQEANVVSRLSSRVFQDRAYTAAEIGSRLQANYIVSGRYREVGSKLLLDLELTNARSELVVWNERKSGTISEFLAPERDLIMPLTANILTAVMNVELQQALDAPMPTLESYTLLVSAISLMNRLSLQAFDRAREMLEFLIDRVPHHAEPYAWLGQWHVLKVQQGWSSEREEQGRVALRAIDRALDINPDSSLAHTIRGVIFSSLLHRLDDGELSFEHALRSNPNQSLAWLQKGCLHAFRGEGDLAVKHTRHAIHLAPFDPLRYLYDSLAGTSALAAHRFEDAHEYAQRSLMVNRTHTSTLRLLAVAQWNLGFHKEAVRTGKELMRLEPSLSVREWMNRTPSAGYAIGEEWGRTLRQIGLPD